MRHYAWLSDEALELVADLIEIMERTGEMPQQLQAIAMPLLPKPRGGHRAVATFVSIYRIWNRLRREEVRRWEGTLERPYFAAGSGRAPQDAVWRQAARAEAAVASSGCSATVLWDLAAFFETIRRRPLWHRAERLGFPMAIAAVAFNAYGSARILSLAGALSSPLMARDGIPAGCGFAMAFTEAYCVEAFDRAVESLAVLASVPPILTVYVDDIAITAEGSATQVVQALTEAEAVVREEIEGPLSCVIEKGNAAVVASSKRVAAILRNRFGDYAGTKGSNNKGGGGAEVAVPNLGIGFAPGRRRAQHGKNTKRRSRMVRLGLKAKRVAKLRAIAGKRTPGVFVTGPLPEAAYGAAVNGLTDSEVTLLRRAAAHAYTPRAKGRSLKRLTLIVGIPTWKAEVEIVLQYAGEVWQACLLGHKQPRTGQMTLPQIAQVWNAVNTADVIKDDGRRRVWANARGPITSLHLTLHRIDWKMVSPFVMHDDFGDEIVLTKTSPQLLAQMLKAAVMRRLQREVGEAAARTDENFMGRRVATEHISSQLKSDRRLSAMDKASYMAVVCNAVMTHDKAVKAGYLVPNRCPLCGLGPDTIFHRIWRCQHAEAVAARNAAAPNWLQREADREMGAATNLFWTTGFTPHPGDVWPRPNVGTDAAYEWRCDEQLLAEDRNDAGKPAIHGKLFIDGSCTTAVFAELRRAAASTVQWSSIRPSGWVIRTPVPRPLPQTPQAAEYVALAVARNYADTSRSIDVASDCANVVQDAGATAARAVSARRAYAAINKENLADLQWRAAAVVRKVPAHVNPQSVPGGPAREDAMGNQMADEAAKEAVLQHPQPTKVMKDDLEAKLKRARIIIRTIAKVTQAFPPMPRERMLRPPRAREGATIAADGGHTWTYGAGLWRCTTCMKLTLSSTIGHEQFSDKCQGVKNALEAAVIERKGHVLAKSMGEVPVVFCIKCGSFAARRAYGLAAQCPGRPTPAGKQALARIRLGRQPWCDRATREYRPMLGESPMAWDGDTRSYVPTGARRRQTRRRRPEAAGDDCALDTDGDLTPPDAKAHRLTTDDGGDAGVRQDVGGGPRLAHQRHHRHLLDEGCAADECHDGGRDGTTAHIEEAQVGDEARRRDRAGDETMPTVEEQEAHGQTTEDRTGLSKRRRIADQHRPRDDGGSGTHVALEKSGHQHGMRERPMDAVDAESGSKRRRFDAGGVDCGGDDCGAMASNECRTSGGSSSSHLDHSQIGDGVMAIGTIASAAVAREGPRGPACLSDTAAAACPERGAAAAAVAKGAEATTLQVGMDARRPDGRRGKVARGPASGRAAPLEDSVDADGGRMGRDSSTISRVMPHAASGGRPRARRRDPSTSQDAPRRLGARPSNVGQALCEEVGMPPKGVVRRRVGNGAPVALASAAWGCDTAAERGHRERPQGGRPRRVQGAQESECPVTDGKCEVASDAEDDLGMNEATTSAHDVDTAGDGGGGGGAIGSSGGQGGGDMRCGNGEERGTDRQPRGSKDDAVDSQRGEGKRAGGAECGQRQGGQLRQHRGCHGGLRPGEDRESHRHRESHSLQGYGADRGEERQGDDGARVAEGPNELDQQQHGSPRGNGTIGNETPLNLRGRINGFTDSSQEEASSSQRGLDPRSRNPLLRPARAQRHRRGAEGYRHGEARQRRGASPRGAGGQGDDEPLRDDVRTQQQGAVAKYIMPWQRRPDWMYLPHQEYVMEGMHTKRRRLTGTGIDMDIEHAGNGDTASRPRAPTEMNREERERRTQVQHGAQTERAAEVHEIRGRIHAPGATEANKQQSEYALGEAGLMGIRGLGIEPGPKGDRAKNRAQQKLDARNAHLRRSLADHAERVARKDRDGARSGGGLSASDRIEAIKRRIALKARAAELVRTPLEGANGDTVAGGPAAAHRGTPGASSAVHNSGTPSTTAADEAAARTAWHDR